MKTIICLLATTLIMVSCGKHETKVTLNKLGKKIYEASYKSGKLDGKSTRWNGAGKLVEENYYTNGVCDSSIMYMDTVVVKTIHSAENCTSNTYVNGKLSYSYYAAKGECDKNGIVYINTDYKNGKKIKQYIHYCSHHPKVKIVAWAGNESTERELGTGWQE
ncbi:MAG TPA: hypothetical protein VK177_16215 [Flavobacteriales bacterium]|nr:hypothetical protein [Flavobacteriales bacterium]